MTIGRSTLEKLDNELKKQDLTVTGEEKPFQFKHKVENLQLQFEIIDCDKFSYLLKSITVQTENKDAEVPFEQLQKRAKTLTDRLTYLVEDLSILEQDSETRKIQIRSVAPEKDQKTLSYFEIILEPRELRFQRVQFDQESQT